MTYWFLYEHFYLFHKQKIEGVKDNLGTLSVQLKNEDELTVTTVSYSNVLFTGIDSLALSYDRTSPNFGKFSVKFVFQEFGTLFTLPELDIKK